MHFIKSRKEVPLENFLIELKISSIELVVSLEDIWIEFQISSIELVVYSLKCSTTWNERKFIPALLFHTP